MDEDSHSTLEDRCNSINVIKDYLVDTSAAWMFYTPVMAASEYFVAGMASKEVAKSRLMAMAVNAVVMRPYGKLRQNWADYWNADAHSSTLKKFAVDTSYSVLFQIPVYSSILFASGASFKESCAALPAGLVVGAIVGRPYGYWLDTWRNLLGRKSTLGERDNA